MRITYLQNPNVEIVNNSCTVGEGIKKTYQYDTPLTRPQLEKWREEFWGKNFVQQATCSPILLI